MMFWPLVPNYLRFYSICELRNHRNIFGVDGGNTSSCVECMILKFSLCFVVDSSINTKNITMIPYHFISAVININFDFDVSIANDFAKSTLPGKVIQGTPCLEVCSSTNENERDLIKLNDMQMLPVATCQLTLSYILTPSVNKCQLISQKE